MEKEPDQSHQTERTDGTRGMYLRFGAMIATSAVVMFALMYLHTYQLAHVRWSETRFFMTLLMAGSMMVVMMSFMLGMYKNKKWNAAIIVGGLALIVLATFLVRTQITVEDRSYMSAMIPHHSIAILTSENSQIEDARVCELAVEIIEAQKREISEMEWLIADIRENGPARTAAEAEQRPVPEFSGQSIRSCP